jgi:hypothetical protein
MTYRLWESSNEAKYKHLKLLRVKGKLPFPPKRKMDTAFPYAVMKLGESFFLSNTEVSRATQRLAISRYKAINRKYSVLFKHYRHRFPIAGIEITRLL